jgi:hypothetical protein
MYVNSIMDITYVEYDLCRRHAADYDQNSHDI